MKKILVTGSRSFNNEEVIIDFISHLNPEQVIIIHGGALGVDSMVEKHCNSFRVQTLIVRPVRNDIPIYYLHRNAEMVGMCDEVVAFWNGKSRGTKFTFDYAFSRKKPVTIIDEDGVIN